VSYKTDIEDRVIIKSKIGENTVGIYIYHKGEANSQIHVTKMWRNGRKTNFYGKEMVEAFNNAWCELHSALELPSNCECARLYDIQFIPGDLATCEIKFTGKRNNNYCYSLYVPRLQMTFHFWAGYRLGISEPKKHRWLIFKHASYKTGDFWLKFEDSDKLFLPIPQVPHDRAYRNYVTNQQSRVRNWIINNFDVLQSKFYEANKAIPKKRRVKETEDASLVTV
jgi:hypothetical protein